MVGYEMLANQQRDLTAEQVSAALLYIILSYLLSGKVFNGFLWFLIFC